MEYFEYCGLKISLFQLSVVRICYPEVKESYHSLVPNRHLLLLIANPLKAGATPTVMRGTPTNKAEGLRAWHAMARQYQNLLDAMPRADIAWITVDCSDYVEHWFIPTSD
jgi:hypothetical protein